MKMTNANRVSEYSRLLHEQTELPGNEYTIETHKIIKFRYQLARSLVKNRKVLEVGCGYGIGVDYLSREAEDIIAGEISGENIAILKNNNKNCKVVQMNAHNLPFKKQSFDVIIAMAMIYYLNFEIYLNEVKRALKEGGTLFFCTSNKDVPGFVPSPHTTRYYSIPELNVLLNKNGFKNEFYGGFPSGGNLIIVNQLVALLKNVTKKMVMFLPNGKERWGKLRKLKEGKLFPLPNNIENIDTAGIEAIPLNPEVRDRKYRIIYVKGTLMTS